MFMDTLGNKVWGFDMGKGSLGEAVRIGNEFKHVCSLLLDADFGEIKTAASLRRQYRTRKAHKAREKWLEDCLRKCGIEVLQRRQVAFIDGKWQLVSKGDIRLEKEFPTDDENICYNSIALRCKLILGEKLESWQVFKALNSAIQNRGYDSEIPWKETEVKSKDNSDYAIKLLAFEREKDELLLNLPSIDEAIRSKFDYPCFFKAYKIGLWNPVNPNQVDSKISHTANKAKGYVIPRNYVEKEFIKLVEMASLQYPKLRNKALFILYGITEKPYASFDFDLRKKFNLKRGAESDWTALGQKIPRFDNRIVDKCKLIPRFNVCKVKHIDEIQQDKDFLYYEITLAMKLLNLRFYRNASVQSLNYDEFKILFEIGKANKFKITKTNLKKFFKSINAEILDENQAEVAQPKGSGRASFSRPAMLLIKELIFSGQSPADFYARKVSSISNVETKKGLVVEDLDFIKLMGDVDWNGIFIPDVETYKFAKNFSEDNSAQINKLIGMQNDPIVRHRLSFFYDRIKYLEAKFGVPDKVVLEFVRDDFIGKEKKKELNIAIKKRYSEKLKIAEKLDEIGFKGSKMLMKLELFQKQGGICLYTGEPLLPTEIPSLEIEHIVPRSRGGPDSAYNFVLTREATNKEKANRTPFEWLSGDSKKWVSYSDRVMSRSKELGKKRCQLLLKENAEELVEKYTALAETAWIARLAQRIVCMHFGFPMGALIGKKRVFTVSGSVTSRIRGMYGLNKILHNTEIDKTLSEVDILKLHDSLETKNRANKKHHALDAMCLCFAPTSKEVLNKNREILPVEIAKDAENYFRRYLDNIIPNKVATMKPRLEETIYSKRKIGKKEYIVRKYDLESLAYKGINPKYDVEAIKKLANSENIINVVAKKIIRDFVNDNPTEQEWKDFCNTVKMPSKNGNGSRLKRILLLVGNTAEYKDLSKDGCGAYRKGDSHKGQIIWKTKSGKFKVEPIYAHSSRAKVSKELMKKPEFDSVAGIFRTGCLVEFKNDVMNDKDEFLLERGIYSLNTIRSDGMMKCTTSNGIPSKPININYFMEAGMRCVIL